MKKAEPKQMQWFVVQRLTTGFKEQGAINPNVMWSSQRNFIFWLRGIQVDHSLELLRAPQLYECYDKQWSVHWQTLHSYQKIKKQNACVYCFPLQQLSKWMSTLKGISWVGMNDKYKSFGQNSQY